MELGKMFVVMFDNGKGYRRYSGKDGLVKTIKTANLYCLSLLDRAKAAYKSDYAVFKVVDVHPMASVMYSGSCVQYNKNRYK